MHALFVFAHQDDEIAAAARIGYLVRSGAAITCVYLTDGEGRRASSAVRDEESRRVLAHLGVDLARVHFAGSQERLPDGALVEHLDRALALLEVRVTEPVDEVWCLAWEGGHQDHDASHLVAVAFAARRGLLGRTFELPLYRRHPLLTFQTLAPLHIGKPWSARRLGVREALRILALCRFYRSQRKTWLGLLPTALVRLLTERCEWTRAVDVTRLGQRPHKGPLLYEKRFGVPWETFERHARVFGVTKDGCD
jgi:LmbE family N-acetylglucosaminyl deacetylase